MFLWIPAVHPGPGSASELLRELPRVGERAEDPQPRRAVGVLQGGEVRGLGGREVAPHLQIGGSVSPKYIYF